MNGIEWEHGGPRDIPDLTFRWRTSLVRRNWRTCYARSRHPYSYMCTRGRGHTGRHAAGTGARIVAVWR